MPYFGIMEGFMSEYTPEAGNNAENAHKPEEYELRSPDAGSVGYEAKGKTEALRNFIQSENEYGALRYRPTAFRTNDGLAEEYHPPKKPIEYVQTPDDLATLSIPELTDLQKQCQAMIQTYEAAMKEDPRWKSRYRSIVDHHEVLRVTVGDEIRKQKKMESLDKESLNRMNDIPDAMSTEEVHASLERTLDWCPKVLEAVKPFAQFFEGISRQRFEHDIDQAARLAIIAHMGIKGENENSHISVREVIREVGAKRVEIDVRLQDPWNPETSDVITYHDTPTRYGTYPQFAETMLPFAENQDVIPHLDIKGGAVTTARMIEELLKIDRHMEEQYAAQGKEYTSIASRVVFSTFTPQTIPVIREMMPNAPVIMHYWKIGHSDTYKIAASAHQNSTIKSRHIAIFLDGAKSYVRNKYGVSVKNPTNVMNGSSTLYNAEDPINEGRTETKGRNGDAECYTFYDDFPPESVLKELRNSNGALSVHYKMIIDDPSYFVRAKRLGIRVGVFGVPNPGNGTEDREEHMRIVSLLKRRGADFFATDAPGLGIKALKENGRSR